jgi:glycosyltransferase involved in cell wall biosynthesis
VLLLSRKEKIHAVFTSCNNLPLLTGFLLKKLGFTWIADLWDDPRYAFEALKSYTSLIWRIKYVYCVLLFWAVKRTLKYADLIIACIVPDVLTYYNIDFNKVFPVTNGVDLNITQYTSEKTSKTNSLAIIYVGSIKESHGIDTIIQASKYLKDNKVRFKVILVGYTIEEDRIWLKRTITSENLVGEVEFIGEVNHEEALRMISQADVCVCLFPRTTVFDCIYPIKLFEYLALGKIVIASRLTGISRIIEDGKNGLLVEPENYRDLAEKIITIYGDIKLKEGIEKEALKTAQKYEWNTINKSIGEKIDNLLSHE